MTIRSLRDYRDDAELTRTLERLLPRVTAERDALHDATRRLGDLEADIIAALGQLRDRMVG